MSIDPAGPNAADADSLANLKVERDAIALYDALASIDREPRRAAAFRAIAATERRHADIWAQRLEVRGVGVPPLSAPRLRVRLIIGLARLFGTRAVSDMVKALEGKEQELYGGQAPDADDVIATIVADEAENAEVWRRLDAEAGKRFGPGRRRTAVRIPIDASRDGVAIAHAAESAAAVVETEHWHRSGRSGSLRAAVFGVSDGLGSNAALVMGVAGAAPDPKFILLSGIAGLLAGAFSMAAGEWVSMKSQRELFERQIALERAELETFPDEEEAELAAAYRAKGFEPHEAARIAAKVFEDPEVALEALVREELGLDPKELGSPWVAAIYSFVSFTLGAAIPVIPYLFGGGTTIFAASLGVSLASMFLIGVGVSLFTGRGVLFSGVRQVLIGGIAVAVTYVVGRAIGVSIA